jgi:hypothetical protein
LILLILGETPRRPAAVQVVTALQECGVEVAVPTGLPPDPGRSDAYRARTSDGTTLTVRVYADEDRDRDRLDRLTQRLLARDAPGERAGDTVESATEHEMLAMVSAARTGARIPEPDVAYPVNGCSL